MKDCYAGDIGDYGKFALLRELHRPDHLAAYDPDLSSRLMKIYHSQDGIVRSIGALENEKLVEDALYFSEVVPGNQRDRWHQRAVSKLTGSHLVFLDPDNGMIVSSAKTGSQKQRKYVLDAEVKDYLCKGYSVLIYQHRPRINEAVYFDRMIQRFMNLKPDIKRSDIQVITFPRYSVRDYFAVSISEDHRLKIQRAIANMVSGVWGSGDKPMCRLPQNFG